MEILTTKAKDGSTYVVNCSFADEDGNAVIPNSIEWKLTDVNGSVINSRDGVVVAPAASISIVLQGDDIQQENGSDAYITIEARYNSSLGTDLPLIDQAKITIAGFIE